MARVPVVDFEAAIDSVVDAAELERNREKSAVQAAKDPLMPESGFRAFIGQQVPAVRVDDVRRIWSFLTEQAQNTHVKGGTGFNIKLLADMCSPNANTLAVYFRATLIMLLQAQGLLDRWRDGNSLQDRVFEVAASFPLPQGPGNVNPNAFVAALSRSRPSLY